MEILGTEAALQKPLLSCLPSVFALEEKDFALVLSTGWPCLPATFRRWYDHVCLPVWVCKCVMCNVAWKRYVVYACDMLCWGHACSGTWVCPALANTCTFRLAKEEWWKAWYSIICALFSFSFNDSYSLVPSPVAFDSPVDPMAYSPVPMKTIQCPLILSRLSRLIDFFNGCLSKFILDFTVLLSRHTLLSLPCNLACMVS